MIGVRDKLGEWFLRGPGVILGAASLCVYRVIYGQRFGFSLLSRVEGAPRVILKNGGTIHLGSVKSRPGLRVFCDGGAIFLDDSVFFNHDCSINSMSRIDIGAGTIFGESVKLYDHNHIIGDGFVSKNSFDVSMIRIGKGCWIGSNVVILPGVTICDNVIIGSGAVISKSISKPGVYVMKNELRQIR